MTTRPSIFHTMLAGQCVLLAIIAACLTGPAAADETAARPATHRIVPGDTLHDLARRYLDDASQWRQFLRYNEIADPRRLQPGMLLQLPPLPDATVIFAHGSVTRQGAAGDAIALTAGDRLQEGAEIHVGPDSYLSLQLDDGSIIRARPDSILRLQRYRNADLRRPNAQRARRALALERGELEISVTPASPARAGDRPLPRRFEVITPEAVAAVRGTRFDVTATPGQTTSGVTTGSVQIRTGEAASGRQALLDTGFGIHVGPDGALGEVRALLAAPDLTALPANLGSDGYVDLSWPATPGAASYRVQLAADEDMQQVLATASSNAPRLGLTGLADGSYVLAVRALDGDGVAGFESRRRARLETTPAFPLYLAPLPQQAVGPAVTLRCTAVAGAAAYHVQIATDADFTAPVTEADQLPACSYQTEALADGRYFWRVAAIARSADGTPRHGPFSRPATFVVDAAKSRQEMPPRLFWQDARGLHYLAQFSRSADFSGEISEMTADDNMLPLDALAPGRYYLRLQASDDDGRRSAFSPPRLVEIEAPVASTVERTWADKPR